jgi:catechol 2,3-dioxygenase-like lactoylglutathione lyase family enzyme
MKTHLDHVGTAVTDLAAAYAIFTRLGFRLTPISHHEGSIEPGQPVQPWGSANHCAMLKRGYLELLGLTDPTLFNPVEAMLARYQGPHIVAFSSADASATYAELKRRADYVMPPRDLGRMAACGPDLREMRRVAFRLVGIARGHLTQARFQFTEHLTPDLIWQPALLDHPNGAVAVTAAHIVSADPDTSAAELATLLDVKREWDASGACRVALEDSDIVFHSRAGWEALIGRPLDKPIPAGVGIGIKVMRLDKTADLLATAGIAAVGAGAALRVPAALACGAELIFEQ